MLTIMKLVVVGGGGGFNRGNNRTSTSIRCGVGCASLYAMLVIADRKSCTKLKNIL